MPRNEPESFESEVFCVPMSSPGDVSQVTALIDDGRVDPKNVVAIMEQTEGDPYCRAYATLAMQGLLSNHLGISHQEVFDRIPMLMIGGVGGIMCPHINLFVKKPATLAASGEERLSIGVSAVRHRFRTGAERYRRLLTHQLASRSQAMSEEMTRIAAADSSPK